MQVTIVSSVGFCKMWLTLSKWTLHGYSTVKGGTLSLITSQPIISMRLQHQQVHVSYPRPSVSHSIPLNVPFDIVVCAAWPSYQCVRATHKDAQGLG